MANSAELTINGGIQELYQVTTSSSDTKVNLSNNPTPAAVYIKLGVGAAE